MGEERIGTYRVVKTLARTADAEIFLATAEGPLGFERKVVLKRLAAGADEKAFTDEAHAWERLDHPCVVKLLDFTTLDERLVMVFEHHDGVPLDAARRMLAAVGHVLDDKAAIHIGAAMFAAIAVKGGAKIHVGEANVLLAWDGKVKLGPFTSGGTDLEAGALLLWELFARRHAPVDAKPSSLDELRSDLDPDLRALVRRALETRDVSAAEITTKLRLSVGDRDGTEHLRGLLAMVRNEPAPMVSAPPPPAEILRAAIPSDLPVGLFDEPPAAAPAPKRPILRKAPRVPVAKPASVPRMEAVKPPKPPPPVAKKAPSAPKLPVAREVADDAVGIVTAVVPAIEATVAALEAQVLAEEAKEKEKASARAALTIVAEDDEDTTTLEHLRPVPDPGHPTEFPALVKTIEYELQKTFVAPPPPEEELSPPAASEPPLSSARAWARDRPTEPDPFASAPEPEEDELVIPGIGRMETRRRRVKRWGLRSVLLACAMAGAFVVAHQRRAMPGVDEKVDGAWSRAGVLVGRKPVTAAVPPPPVATAIPAADAGAR